MDVLHTAVWVSDIDATLNFYCEGIGLERSRNFTTDGVENHFLIGEGSAELQFKYESGADRTVRPTGIDHLAIGVDDVHGLVDELVTDWDSELVSEPRVLEKTGSTIAFVTDPDGYTVELIESA